MAATTWNPLYKTTNLTLSGGNLIGTSVTSGTNGVEASAYISGPTYAEFTMGASLTGSAGVGVGSAGWPANTLGTDLFALVYQKDGTVKINSVTLATIATFAANDRIDIAVWPLYQKVWLRVAGGAGWNNDVIGNQDPANNIGGISYATLTGYQIRFLFVATTVSPTQSCTAKFSTAFTGTAPVGFSSNDTVQATARNASVPNGVAYTAVYPAKAVAPQSAGAVVASILPSKYGSRMYSPAATATTVSGVVTEAGVNVAKTIRLYDKITGELLGSTTSNASTGVYSIPAVGRVKVFVVGFDDPTYDAVVHDAIVPL